MERLTVNVRGQQVEVRYPYSVLKKIERENKNIFAMAKPTLENTEKLLKYGLEHAILPPIVAVVDSDKVNDAEVERVMEQLIEQYGVMDAIMVVLKNYMYAINPKMDFDKGTEGLDEQGLAQVNNLVSEMLGI